MQDQTIENQVSQFIREKAIIDLTIDSREFTQQNVIHKAEFKKVKGFIEKQVKSLKKSCDIEQDFEGIYKTILVEGGRETGKTTFFKAFFNEYTKLN